MKPIAIPVVHSFSSVKAVWLMAILLMFCSFIYAQVDYFTLDVDTLSGLWYSESDWGDFDNDNDLDLMMIGYGLGGANGQGFHRFYRNDGNSLFHELNTGMIGAGNGTARFADLDGDNDLDAIICGQTLLSMDSTVVYINNSGTFVDSGAAFPSRVSSSISFGDYDNDGDLDILLTGGTIADVSTGFMQIFRNEGSFIFTPVEVLTPGIRNGMAEFGDYNNDGYLDIAFAGSAGSGNYVTKILKGSSAGTFTEVPLTLLGLRYSKVAWVDYDCDGDLDLMVSGSTANEVPSEFKLYRNDGNNTFTDVAQLAVLGERQGDLAWGDFNNDGYADIVLNGLITNTTTVANVYLYAPATGLYVDAQTMIYLKYACMSIGDYNNDNKLDMSLSGHYDYQDYWNDLYLNPYNVSNTPPSAPVALEAVDAGNPVYFTWQSATDTQTPATGLSYNLRVGTSPGANDVVSSMANSATGWRKVARSGNAGQRLFYEINNLPNGVYYWSVQAIDNTFAGSAFATEQILFHGVANDDQYLSARVSLSNHPNPFSANTTLCAEIKSPGQTKIEIYNIKGQLVTTLTDGKLNPGLHSFTWDGTDSNKQMAASGIYTARLTHNNEVTTHKLMLVK